MDKYDGVIIGGGPGGYEAALYASRLGKKTAIVECNRLGGVCLQMGCIPTKTLFASAKSYSVIKNPARYGLNPIELYSFEWSKLRAHKQSVINNLTTGLEKQMKACGIDVFYGIGSLVDGKTVEIRPKDNKPFQIQGDKIFIATGSKPCPVPGTDWESDWLTPGEYSFQWDELPRSVLLVGAGVMGVEFAFLYNMFGVDIHMVEALDQVLPSEDSEISRTLARELKKIGVKTYTGKKIISYQKEPDSIAVEIEGGVSIMVDKILICAGRKGITDGIGLEKVGVEIDSHANIKTDKHNRTSVDNIYAFGDVSGPPLLAHAAWHEGKIAISHAFKGIGENDLDFIPSGIFTIPEIGRVGLTEQKCVEKGIKYKIGMATMRAIGRAHAETELTGFAKIIVDENYTILGAHILGKEAAEIIHIVALAMSCGMTSRQLEDKLIFSHPTLSEVIWEALKNVNNPL